MNVRIYCRASTEGQHADRALVSLREFAQSKKLASSRRIH